MGVGDQEYQNQYPHTSAIYQTTGAGGKIVGVTRLKSSIDVIGFRIDGTTVIGPEGGTNLVPFYKYPAGGSPIKTLKNKAFNGPFVAAISLAKQPRSPQPRTRPDAIEARESRVTAERD